MNWTNINVFMDRFHAIEHDAGLFEDNVGDELWWDSVRFEACYYLYGCLTGLTYSSAHLPPARGRKLGVLRRWALRQGLLAKARFDPGSVLAIRVPRNIVAGRSHDVVFDPIATAFSERMLVVDTLPRRYHLPEYDPARWAGTVPRSLSALVATLIDTFGLDAQRAPMLEELIRRIRSQYAWQVAGYRRLFDVAHPRGLLMVQNGIEKALFHVAREAGVPSVEAQHGLIGHGHPAYSYSREIDYSRQTGMPDLFLTFSPYWGTTSHYPARRQAVVGTDHFATGFGAVEHPLGAIMVITANIYHTELLELTRQVAAKLSHRRVIYKLHPNQAADASTIVAAFADQPNVEVGDAMTPASRLMKDVSHLVAIQSTVVYEALQHGRRICIVPRYDHEIHADIFGLPGVAVVGTADTLSAELERPATGVQGSAFFQRFDQERVRELLDPLLGRKT
ncbi:hypothetical protein [Sphingomonas sp. Leaf21]|uniref:hypothetical protein n=1 Tax=Sphingomonas sp. Leaf21 TaxID=2876550 RepID=UPI001E641756|nr:hypothetical protein [Sphingomonas sp. Leaf21]